jgi:serine/threonine protein kinase
MPRSVLKKLILIIFPLRHLNSRRSDIVKLGNIELFSLRPVSMAFFAPALTLIAVRHIDVEDVDTTNAPVLQHLISRNESIRRDLADRIYLSMQPISLCPYLVGSHGVYTDEENAILNLIQEHMNGGSIQTKIDDGQLFSIDDATVLAYSMLRALAALHENGIVHHEVRPSNMLLDTDGHVKLTDFGFKTGELLRRDSLHKHRQVPPPARSHGAGLPGPLYILILNLQIPQKALVECASSVLYPTWPPILSETPLWGVSRPISGH